jgi:MFS family permease
MVAFAFLAVMAFSAVPSPLYGLYRARDHFSLFMVTVIYAVYAFGVIGALLLGGHLSDWYGRRRLLLPALGVAIVSAIVFLVSKSLASLLVGRLLNGIAIGIVVSTATAYRAELHAVGRPEAPVRRAQLTASAIPVGGIGLGALLAGILAQWVAHPRVPEGDDPGIRDRRQRGHRGVGDQARGPDDCHGFGRDDERPTSPRFARWQARSPRS